MIKQAIIIFLFIFTFCSSLLKAQEGREWIVSGQPYYKIPVAEEGVYAIPYAQLNSSGIATGDLSKLQVWFRGKEQSIHLNNDTLFFYGIRNDGALDSLIYEPYSARSNKYYSLISDTTYYFLTIGSSPGKRVDPAVAAAGLAQAHHIHTETIFYADEYSAGMLYSADTHLSPGDQGEGWVSHSISQGGTNPALRTIEIPIANLYNGPSAGNVQLEIMLVGTNQNAHNIDILIGNPSSPLAIYPQALFYGRSNHKFTQSFPVSFLTNNQPLQVTIRVKGTPNNPDMVALTYIVLKYPQMTNLSGKSFYFIEPVNDNAAKTLSLTNFTNNSLLWDISTEGAFTRLGYNYAGGNATTHVLPSTTKILYANAFKAIIGIAAVDMTPYQMGQGKMLLITHSKLLALGSASEVMKYAAYRASHGTSVTVTDVNKLYNLYTYGEKHPMAIKRYCKEELNSGVAQYLFLVGKGINYDYSGNTDEGYLYYRKNPLAFINNTFTYQQLNYRMEDLIPAYGWPSSDLYYSITDGTLRPKLATGRLSARTNKDVEQYLDKVTANDLLDSNQIWRKSLLHLSGGKNTSEISYFRTIVDGFKNIAEGPRFGGHVVRTYTKDLTAGAVDNKLINSVADEVNKGVSYITFFGHSSPSIIDLDIGNVSNNIYGYNNADKYPLLIMNGCQSAEFFIQGSIPEDWIMTPKKGAILALGHGDIGYPTYMKTYTEYLYKLNFADNRFLNSSIGDIQKKTIDSFLTTYAFDFNNQIVKAQATQFTLQGDPTVKLYKPQHTDYAIAGDAEVGEKKVFIKAYGNGPISAMADSFAIGIPITNYGISNRQNIQLKVKHTVTNNNAVIVDEVYPIRIIAPIGYVDTFYFTIQGKNPKLLGINRFEITVDPNDSIPEMDENNNFASLEYFVPLSSITCLFPSEYSVVHEQPVSFVAQSIDLFQPTKNYYVEIDTSHLFNSPSKITRTVSSGALVKFTQNLLTDVLPSDSVVYYWRIRFEDLLAGADTLWGESSFIYIKDSPDGWSQSEYPQLFKDTYKNISISPTGNLSFITTTSRLVARTHATDNTVAEIGLNNNSLLSFIPGGPNCGYENGCLIVVFGAESALPYLVDPDRQCGVYLNPQVQRYFDMSNPGTQEAVDDFLKGVQAEEFVLFMSTGPIAAHTWSASLKATFEDEYGAQRIDDLGAETPYILLSRHRPGTTPLQEIISTDPINNPQIEMNYNLEAQYSSGTITSTLIGPSTAWGTLYKTIKKTNDDFAELKIMRLNMAGQEMGAISVPLDGDIDLAPLIDANQYPYIRLMLYTSDTTDFTPAYLKKWQVIYSPSPEGTINPFLAGVDKYTVSDKNLGQSFTLPFGFENISDKDFAEPLRVVFSLRTDRGSLKRDTVTIGLLPKGQSILFNYTVNIGTSVGKNILQVYVNPKLQREMYFQNNVQEVSFTVQEDRTHPVVGAMFDGIHIFDGDLVSPSPTISVTLVDNNNLLPMNDSTMTITLIYPDQSSHIIRPGSPEYSIPVWIQDPTDKSKFKVEFKPNADFVNGKYKLIIQGKDASGNRSGNQNLEINFEVLNESTITNFYPYPNPFSTSCRFVFTLTGKEIPEDVKIQIMTVSGKVVREIFKNELGNIHIGDNITDYAWDGRDEFGDKLANGVYIYRVIIKNQNDKFDHRETSGDKAFKKGYGKLYILR